MPGYKTYQEAAEAALNSQIEDMENKNNYWTEEKQKEEDKKFDAYWEKILKEGK